MTTHVIHDYFLITLQDPRSGVGSTRNRSRFLDFLHIVVATRAARHYGMHLLFFVFLYFFFSVTCTENTKVLTNGNATFQNCTDGVIHIYMTCLKSVTESAGAISRICCQFHVQTPSYRSTKRPGIASVKSQLGFNCIQSLLWLHHHTFVQYTTT